jgi:hypothetical protein
MFYIFMKLWRFNICFGYLMHYGLFRIDYLAISILFPLILRRVIGTRDPLELIYLVNRSYEARRVN